MTEQLTHALEHTANGWAVFPLITKEPATPNGFKDASRDPDTVRAMFRKYGAEGTGGAVPAGYVVADGDLRGDIEDTESLIAAMKAIGIDPFETWSQQTGSGGVQCLYRDPEGRVRQTQGKHPFLDTRKGGRGYVVLSGSAHFKRVDEDTYERTGGVYEMLNEMPLDQVPEVPACLP